MCGIAGCISKTDINKDKFEKMVDIVAHRGPDDRGTYYAPGIALGHRRLSIIDLSMDGHQPFLYEQDYVVVFNGEIYNYLELREELAAAGFPFRTQTDTEVLAAAYACWGEECVLHFNGMWAFLIYDKNKNIVFGSRDRFGVKPFYFTQQEGMFLAASEIKQFFEMLENNPKVNREALLQFLIKGNLDYSEETMFRDIFQLMGGYNILFDIASGTYKIKKYYDFEDFEESCEEYSQACESFREQFIEAVGLRLRADVPIGYSLSGGLDSSAIVCAADAIVKKNKLDIEQHTISSCFEDKRYDEQEYIDEVIRNTNVNCHKIFPQEADLFEKLDSILWNMDEPFGSTSVFAAWNVYRASKDNGLKVMLSGQGADEQLAGYTDFYVTHFTELLFKRKYRQFVKEWIIYKEKRAVTEQHISIKEILKSCLVSIVVPDKKRYLVKAIGYAFGKNKVPFTKKQIVNTLKAENLYPMHNARGFIAAYMKNEMRSLLHYEDRNSMSHSVEVRLPFLDYRLVQKLYEMPFNYKLRDGVTKAVLRDGLNDILPEKVRKRYSKLGFVTPEDQWINNNYDKYREELRVSATALSGILDVEKVMRWFEKKKGNVHRGDFLAWRIICAGRWMKLFHVSMD